MLDVLAIILVSVAAYGAELALDDVLPWRDEARGAFAPVAGALAALWLTRRRGGGRRDLGLRRPRRWSTAPLWALGIFVAFAAAQMTLPSLLSNFIALPEADFSRYDALRGNLSAALAMALVLPLTASIPEEIIYRGFLQQRFSLLAATERGQAIVGVAAQALLFGAIHYQWGVGGILLATIMGIIWGCAFLLCGRNLWILIMAHSTGHIALIVQLYSSSPA